MEKWFVLAVAAVVINCCSGEPINPARASGKGNPSTLVSAIYDKHDHICSGFHIRNDYVITIASCVENKMMENLRVRSYVLKKTRQYSYTAKLQTFHVDQILYPPGRGERPNFLSLVVLTLSKPPFHPVVTVALPPFNFFSRIPILKGLVFKSTNKSPNVGIISSNLKECLPHRRSENGYRNVFFCVRQENRKSFSVAPVDVGAPALGVFQNKFYVLGIANVPQGNKENHFYYSIFKDLKYLHDLITPVVFPPDLDVRLDEDKGSYSSDKSLSPYDDRFDPWIPSFAYWSTKDSTDDSPKLSDDFLTSTLDDSSYDSDHPFIYSPTDILKNPSENIISPSSDLGSPKDDFSTPVDVFIYQSSSDITSGTSQAKPDPNYDFITSPKISGDFIY